MAPIATRGGKELVPDTQQRRGSDDLTIGERLRSLRERHMLTQLELGEQARVDGFTIGNVEKGHVNPRMSTVRKLADALGVAPQWLMYGEVTEPVPEEARTGPKVGAPS